MQGVLADFHALSPWDFLLQNWKPVVFLFESDYCELPVHKQLTEAIPEFAAISKTTYRRFLKKVLHIRYGTAKVAHANCDSAERKEERRIATVALLHALSAHAHVFFFDETTVAESSFRCKVWKKIGKPNTHLERKIVFGTFKLLLLVSAREIVNYWVVARSSSEVICAFLDESVELIRSDYKAAPLLVFLDNAKMHKTLLMQQFSEQREVHLLFNAANSSKSMPAEYIFEKVKREFRRRVSKRPRENVSKTLWEECRKLGDIDARHAYERAKIWMRKAIERESFWIK